LEVYANGLVVKKKSPELLSTHTWQPAIMDSPSPPSVTLLSRVWGCQYQLQKRRSGPPLSIAFHYIYMDGLRQ